MSASVSKGSPLRWRQVRQAINCGFDRRKMMLYLRNSLGTPAESGFVPAGLPSFDSGAVKGYHYDPARARELLAADVEAAKKSLAADSNALATQIADTILRRSAA